MFDKNSRIAVVGVSSDPSKFGHRIFKTLVAGGYDVCGVNPKGGTVAGRELFASIGEITPAPEVAVLVVPAQSALALVPECSAAGVKVFWMQPGADSDEAERAAREAGMRVVRGACFMVEAGEW